MARLFSKHWLVYSGWLWNLSQADQSCGHSTGVVRSLAGMGRGMCVPKGGSSLYTVEGGTEPLRSPILSLTLTTPPPG